MLLLSSVKAGQAMMFANHSLESCFSQRIREFLGSFPAVFWHLSMDFTMFFNVILSDLIKLSPSFQDKKHNCKVKKHSHININAYCFERVLQQ